VSAAADDLRYFYAEHLGRAQLVSVVTAGGTEPAEPLEPGRYELSFAVPGAGVTRVWVTPQGPHGTLATGMALVAPNTPIELGDGASFFAPFPRLRFIVRPPGSGNATNPPIDSIALRSVGGTVTAVIQKISRGKQ
jgi:hypothetical protein